MLHEVTQFSSNHQQLKQNYKRIHESKGSKTMLLFRYKIPFSFFRGRNFVSIKSISNFRQKLLQYSSIQIVLQLVSDDH